MEPQNTDQNNPVVPQSPDVPAQAASVPQADNAPASPPPAMDTPPTTPQSLHNKPQLSAQAEKLKKLAIQVMIGALIGAAALAVVAVLAGSFNSIFQKSLFTLFVVVLHALACLGFIDQTGRKQESSFKFFENVIFSIIVLSFITAVFGIWGIISGEIVGKLYITYFILLFAALHGQMLVAARGKQQNVDMMINANYFAMGTVVFMLLVPVWLMLDSLPDAYYRILAAVAIIDGTLTILVVILNKLYLQKHPEVSSNIFVISQSTGANGAPTQVLETKRRIHPLIWLLGIYVVGQILIGLIMVVVTFVGR